MGEFEFEFELVMCIGSDDVVLEGSESGAGEVEGSDLPHLEEPAR
jgi:hypothetical protein